MHIRNSAKAVVIKDGRVLLTRLRDERGVWYCFPGGGQEPGETLAAAAQRECLEETGLAVAVDEMITVLEWLDQRHDTHAIEFYFKCRLLPDAAVAVAKPDTNQEAVEWVPLANLRDIELKPNALREILLKPRNFQYLGLVP
jgi:8-oxo-dGTP pyrophosphatase MutT (NUDIX family)